MSDADKGESLRHRLGQFGDAHESDEWETGKIDYVATLNLTAADIPELLTVARQWTEPREWPKDANDMSEYAPIHAWRCLAQLGATEAIGPLIEMLDSPEAEADDWSLEEFPLVFAWIGPASIPALRDYLPDASHGLYARVCTAQSLQEVAKRHPHTRDEVVRILSDALSGYEDNDEEFNAFLVSYLLELKATEAAELIERAHAADRVEISICGNWNMVRKELGVEGLGLVPKDLAAASLFRNLPLLPLLPQVLLGPISSHQVKHQKERRAQRKRQRQDRKRNRKR